MLRFYRHLKNERRLGRSARSSARKDHAETPWIRDSARREPGTDLSRTLSGLRLRSSVTGSEAQRIK